MSSFRKLPSMTLGCSAELLTPPLIHWSLAWTSSWVECRIRGASGARTLCDLLRALVGIPSNATQSCGLVARRNKGRSSRVRCKGFFLHEWGAVCAGCAQVTLVECQESYKPGCNQSGEETTRQAPKKPNTNKTNTNKEGKQPVVQLEVPGRHERVKREQ